MEKHFGIYVHIPFCIKKCAYCDFVSFGGCDDNLKERYVEALKKEIRDKDAKDVLENDEEKFSNNIVDTIYIGGGTPSVIDSKYIGEILDEIKKKYSVSEDAEITIEVNPGTIDEEKVNDYKRFGINRISMGLQTSDNGLLDLIGRIHTYEEFEEAYKLVKKVGFENINVDLMIGLPTQTLEDVSKSVMKVISLFPTHVSLYSLINEEGTPLTQDIEDGFLPECDEDLERKMYWEAKYTLESAGFFQYEISNFAGIGKESKHNLNCWNQESYIGYGLASHSYYKNIRFSNTTNINEYIDKINLGNIKDIINIEEIQDDISKEKEYIMLGLRKFEGVNSNLFKEKFGKDLFIEYKNEIEKLEKEELITKRLDGIALSKKGIDFANLAFEEFV